MNKNRLEKCFAEALGLAIECVNDQLSYNSVKQWDSVAHMALVAALETEFNVMMDTEEIIALSSVGAAKIILRKHGVDL